MITKMLKVTLAASMAMPAVSAILPGNAVFAQELPAEAVTENTMDTTIGSGLEMTDIIETPELDGTVELPMLPEQAETEIVLPETGEITEETVAPEVTETVTEDETAAAEEEAAVAEEEVQEETRDSRPGTNLTCDLDLDVKVDGATTSELTYLPHVESHSVQIGGTLHMNGVWSSYNLARTGYIGKQVLEGNSWSQAEKQFHTKSLVGSWTYSFQINPKVVTVNETILKSTDAWQEAFRQGTGADGAAFFDYMHCTGVDYDKATGLVTVRYAINEKGTGMVSTKTIDKAAGAKPKYIKAYSPEGAFTIHAENMKKGATAVYGNASFQGEIDMSPWMAIAFPLRYKGEVVQPNLTLGVEDAQVTFDVENGTWADGTTDTLTEMVEVDVIKLGEGSHMVAGTLQEHQIPTGIIAVEGYDQNNGAWDSEPTTEENATVFHGSGVTTRNNGLSVGYTYSFPEEPGKPVDPENPEQPDTPVTPEKPDQPDTPENPGEDNSNGENPDTNKKPEDSGNGTNSAEKPSAAQPSESKPASKVPTAAATGLGFTLGLQALSVAGILAILKKKRCK